MCTVQCLYVLNIQNHEIRKEKAARALLFFLASTEQNGKMSLLVLEMRDKEAYSHISTEVDNKHNRKDVQSPDNHPLH